MCYVLCVHMCYKVCYFCGVHMCYKVCYCCGVHMCLRCTYVVRCVIVVVYTCYVLVLWCTHVL